MRMLALALMALLPLQDPPKKEEPKEQEPEEILAITHVKILTITKGDIESGTILIKNGKIAQVAAEVKIPESATVVEGKGLVAMPGFINAYARGIRSGYGYGGGSNPQFLAYDELDPTADYYHSYLPRTGFTTVGVYPATGIISGQGVVIKPVGFSKETMVASKSAFLRIQVDLNTMAKDTLKREFDAAKKLLEAEKKAEEEKKKQPQPSTQGTSGAPPPNAPKMDERSQVLLRFIKGELPTLIDVGAPAQVVHWWQVAKGVEGIKIRTALVCGPEVYKAAESLGEKKATVVLRTGLTSLPYTRDRVNPAAELVRAGAHLVLRPSDDNYYDGFLLDVAQLVKYGLDRQTALRAFTINAAEVLGMEKQIGSLEAGKDADVVLLSGDPFSALTDIRSVFVNGRNIFERKGE